MLIFSASEVEVSRFDPLFANPHLRYGQAFHQYFNLNRITNPEDVSWCDKLYNAPNEIAKNMVRDRTDVNQ